MFITFIVRVDSSGFTARSWLGWPKFYIPLNEVVRASVVNTVPFEDFGGWGWRIALDGTHGIVTRKGEALLIERTGDREFIATVDDAAGAAALLNTLAERERAPRQ